VSSACLCVSNWTGNQPYSSPHAQSPSSSSVRFRQAEDAYTRVCRFCRTQTMSIARFNTPILQGLAQTYCYLGKLQVESNRSSVCRLYCRERVSNRTKDWLDAAWLNTMVARLSLTVATRSLRNMNWEKLWRKQAAPGEMSKATARSG